MSAKSDYMELEYALYTIERRAKPIRGGRKHWDPRARKSRRAALRSLTKKFWDDPSEEDIPSVNNADLFWNGDSLDREHVIGKLDRLLGDEEFIEHGELTDLVWPPAED